MAILCGKEEGICLDCCVCVACAVCICDACASGVNRRKMRSRIRALGGDSGSELSPELVEWVKHDAYPPSFDDVEFLTIEHRVVNNCWKRQVFFVPTLSSHLKATKPAGKLSAPPAG